MLRRRKIDFEKFLDGEICYHKTEDKHFKTEGFSVVIYDLFGRFWKGMLDRLTEPVEQPLRVQNVY